MPRPTVVVTRPAGQSRQLTEALHAAGLDVLGFPLLAIGPAADDTALRTALGRLADYALVVFVSPNAVSFALDALAQVQETAGAAQWPAHVPVAVVGPSSVAALAERGIAPPTHRVIAPAGAQVDANAGGDGPGEAPRFDSEALWSELDTTPGAFSGRRVLIIRGNGGRDWLGDRLREAGATVDAVEAYTRTLPEPTGMQLQAVRASLTPGAPPYAWLLTSSEAVRNLDALARLHLSPPEHERLKQVQCIAPHARIAAQAQALGFAHVLPAAPGDAGLLAACTQWGNAHAGPAAPPVAMAATAATVATPAPAPAPVPQPAPQPAPVPAPGATESTGSSGSTTTKVERVTPDTTSPSSSSTAPAGATGTSFTMHAHGTPGAGRRNMAAWWAIGIILVLAIAGGFFWLQMRVEHLTQELARRQQSNDALVQETRVLSKSAQDTVKELQAKVGALDGQVVEARDKQAALEQVYQDLMRNRDDWEIAEIQQLLTNAGQQLQLTGNVQVALAALQSADARLARSDKPQYNLLRRAIARDIARMKAVPDTDLTGAAIKLDESINQIDALPLLSGERMLDRVPGETGKPAAPEGKGAASAPVAGGNVLTRTWDYVLAELGQVIRVRKVEDTNALLLSGDQGWFLRENVKLRLLNARLALLSRNEPVFRNDLAAAQAMIGRYFDTRSRRVQGVLTLLKQAQASAVTVSLPTMAESLGALRALKKE